MTVEDKIRGRQVGVLGMARSGVAAARLARQFGAEVFVSDAGPADRLKDPVAILQNNGIACETGGHTDRLLDSDYVIISPGIPLTVDIVGRLREKGIPIFSELEFASWVCEGKIIAITGSNGKTTTTTLTGEIFKAAGFDTFVCGNIGCPFAGIADKVGPDGVAVVEVSTFQLETIADFQPHVAAILNLAPDHLDRHGTFQAYKDLKFRITENQTANDVLVANFDDAESVASNVDTSAVRLGFSVREKGEAMTFVRDNVLCAVIDGRDTEIINCDDIKIRGRHNLQNAAAAIVTALQFDIAPETIADVLRSFPGVEHRLEQVGRVAGIQFINDSKATNVDSVVVALTAMTEQVHLIMGGLDKGAPYDPLVAAGAGKVKSIVAIGKARMKIFDALGKTFPTQFADSLEEAVSRCFEAAIPGETVLLSPACASFDMFDSFEHRGRAFKNAVAALTKGSKTNNGTLTNS